MKYVLLGRSGLRVSRICFGTAALGVVPQEAEAPALINRALELGINFFDTATSYGNRSGQDRPGVPPAELRKASEEILGDCLQGHRDEVIIATKVQERVGTGVNDGGPEGGGLTRYHMMKRLELSLKRLRTDHVDIYYAHHPDPTTPIEETLRAFDDMIHQGKVRYIALSTFPSWQVVDVLWKADKYNLNSPICLQHPYSLVQRGIETELIPAAARNGLSLCCFAPLAGGLLTGMETIRKRPIAELGGQRWRQGQGPGFSEAELKTAENLDALSGEWRIPASNLALGWLLAQPTVAATIIGPETIPELEEDAAAADLDLTAEQVQMIGATNK